LALQVTEQSFLRTGLSMLQPGSNPTTLEFTTTTPAL
jgi:hypothetical protein